MNLNELIETQKVLRDRISYDEPDRLNKLILALLVEIGECANEWRGFKYWSKDQAPRIDGPIDDRRDTMTRKNPLLEEYVDGLHFVLELGIEISFSYEKYVYRAFDNRLTITDKFIDVFQAVYDFDEDGHWFDLYQHYLGLGKMLGFTWEEIEEAYYQKNQINHVRQNNGY